MKAIESNGHVMLMCRFLEQSKNDDKIRMPHICIFYALVHSYAAGPGNHMFSITRSGILRLSKIHSKTTYHKCINDLQEGGYIKYFPSFHPVEATKVIICE